MRAFVFDVNHIICGDISVIRDEIGFPQFRRQIVHQSCPIAERGKTATYVDFAIFRWTSFNAARSLYCAYSCKVLEVDRPDDLHLLPDFRYFAEIFGDKSK